MTKTVPILAGAILLLLAGPAPHAGGSDRASAESILARFSDAPPMAVGCIACHDCGGGIWDWDDTAPFKPYSETDSGGCWRNYCPEPDCEQDGEQMAQLWAAFETVTGEELETLLTSFPAQVAYVPSVGAFQFSSCEGIVGQMPASPAQIAALQ